MMPSDRVIERKQKEIFEYNIVRSRVLYTLLDNPNGIDAHELFLTVRYEHPDFDVRDWSDLLKIHEENEMIEVDKNRILKLTEKGQYNCNHYKMNLLQYLNQPIIPMIMTREVIENTKKTICPFEL